MYQNADESKLVFDTIIEAKTKVCAQTLTEVLEEAKKMHSKIDEKMKIIVEERVKITESNLTKIITGENDEIRKIVEENKTNQDEQNRKLWEKYG